jgi:hypothetical protein
LGRYCISRSIVGVSMTNMSAEYAFCKCLMDGRGANVKLLQNGTADVPREG